jgi:hypothetical protein
MYNPIRETGQNADCNVKEMAHIPTTVISRIKNEEIWLTKFYKNSM